MDSKHFLTADLSMISTPTDLPTDVYKYMIQNASSHQRSKLMESGKFFYPKVFVKIDRAEIYRNRIDCYKRGKDGSLKDVTAELSQSLWIAKRIFFRTSTDAQIHSLPKSAVWNLQILTINSQVMSYETIKFLTSSGGVGYLRMTNAQIEYNDTKKEVPLENIFEMFPNCFNLYFWDNVPSIASLEAANINRPSGLRGISMHQLDEKFDFKIFSTFMINNQDLQYRIVFKKGISEEYVKELKAMVIKINEAWNDQLWVPHIEFL